MNALPLNTRGCNDQQVGEKQSGGGGAMGGVRAVRAVDPVGALRYSGPSSHFKFYNAEACEQKLRALTTGTVLCACNINALITLP